MAQGHMAQFMGNDAGDFACADLAQFVFVDEPLGNKHPSIRGGQSVDCRDVLNINGDIAHLHCDRHFVNLCLQFRVLQTR